MKAAILSIGDEILKGNTINTNANFIAELCESEGISISRVLTVSDSYEGIDEGLKLTSVDVKVVFITGGLGPTKDDITKQALADYFQTDLIFNESVFQRLEAFFRKRGREVVELNRKLAMLPEKARLIPNKKGTALGMRFEKDGILYYSMPGVPFEMKTMLTQEILPDIKRTHHLPEIINRYVMTAGIGESSINSKISDIEKALPPHVSLAYLPSMGRVKLRLSSIGNNDEEVEDFQIRISERLKKYTYALDEKTSIAAALGKILKEKGLNLSVAESCTGGYISHLITSVPGSSEFYPGSVISYSNRAKTDLLNVDEEIIFEHGAVSEKSVEKMLKGVLKLMQGDVGIAVSGIAGPGGGTPDKPVGTVWIAVGDKKNMIARKYELSKQRDINIRVSAILALNLLRRYVLGELEHSARPFDLADNI